KCFLTHRSAYGRLAALSTGRGCSRRGGGILMRRSFMFVFGICLAVAVPVAQAQTGKALNIYVVDVEGGNATLFVAPSGESVLIDTGNGGPAAPRDAGRIM